MLPLHTERLDMVNFTEAHLTDEYLSWLTDQETVRYSNQRYRNHTFETCRDYLSTFEESTNCFLAIIGKNEDGYLGTLTVYFDESNGIADVGILLGRRSWGRGYGTEAFGGMCDALLRAGIRKVTAGTAEPNGAMRTIMDRCGMVPDGRRREHFVVDGVAVDIVHGAIFRLEN